MPRLLPRLRRIADQDRDRGAVSLMVAVLAVGLLLIAALVVDGGGRMRAAQRMDTLAAEAARAAGQAIDVGTVISSGQTVVDPNDAAQAAADYLDAAGVPAAGRTITLSPDRRTITITVTSTYTPVFSGTLGINTQVTATARATLIHGVTNP